MVIRDDGNVSSVTDNGVGEFAVNFDTAMPDANYSGVGTCSSVGGSSNVGVSISDVNQGAPVTTAFKINTRHRSNNANGDPDYVCVAIFR